jgi:NAD(P)-dependent dehydrogenase (short-subunit alcohol dehydrogenase family)
MPADSLFSGKICVITGSAMGIGLALAQSFARAKARVVMADINFKLAETEASALRQAGLEATACQLDVTDAAAMGKRLKTKK